MQLQHEQHAEKYRTSLYNAIEKARLECGIPGMSVAVLSKGEFVFAEGFGKRNQQGDPFNAATICPIGSVTKSFTATAIGEMVAEGKLDWDTTPVNNYLPEFELKDPRLTSQLTFVDLLSHRSVGLGNLPIVKKERDCSTLLTCPEPRIESIKRLRHAEFKSKLGSKMNYSNAMYTVAGEAAARVAGMSYEDVVREKVIKPLGLDNTGFSQAEMKDRFSNHAMPFSVASFEDAQKGNYKAEELEEVYMTLAPAGDMYSNVLDLAKWGRIIIKDGELDGKQVLNKESVQETLKPQTIINGSRRGPEFPPMLNYGLGWILDSYKGRAIYKHTGNLPSHFSCRLIMFPDDDLVIAQLYNHMYNVLGNHIQFHIADEILDLPRTHTWMLGEAVEETKAFYNGLAKQTSGDGKVPKCIPSQAPVHPLEAYTGDYFHPLFGELSVLLDLDEDGKNKERLLLCRRGACDPMEHLHFEQFVVPFADITGVFKAVVTFQTRVDGKVGSVVLDAIDAWVFTKAVETSKVNF
ncbi:hypothetical protein EC968_009670 [Mortierella alpina]|nr:hypothetical protein EC968_009670 [Mortierella alpina]